MPPSVMTPSTSRPMIRMRRSTSGALRDGNVGQPRRRKRQAAVPVRVALVAGRSPNLFDGASHPFRVHPLSLLYIDRPSGGARGLEQVRLSAEERRYLEHVGNLGD